MSCPTPATPPESEPQSQHLALQPLAHWPLAQRRRICGVLSDIDDTLTTHGHITPDALQALHALRAAGWPLILITGRSLGWSLPLAQSWPVNAIVAENGAVAALPDASTLYQQDSATRRANHQRLQAVAQRVLQAVPGATLATDSAGRETDIAIDHSEHKQLPAAAIQAVLRIMRNAGLQATVSSIHINGWLGTHNKLSGARWILRQLLGRELDAERELWVYVGDSSNDQPMFEHCPHSVGVANIRHIAAQLTHLPRYITEHERGAGFAEVVQALLAAQQPSAAPAPPRTP